MQFAFVKPICAIAAVCLEPFDLFADGVFALNRGFLYFTIITNASVTVALYALVLFYIAAKEELEIFNPLAKFLCVKAILFFSFWQSIAIALLTHFGVLNSIGSWSQHQISVLLQDLAICCEMFILAIVHIWAFSYLEYRQIGDEAKTAAPADVLRNFGATMSQRDLIHHVFQLSSLFFFFFLAYFFSLRSRRVIWIGRRVRRRERRKKKSCKQCWWRTRRRCC